METFHEIATAHCAPALQDALAAAITALGHTPIRLPSGAGHDAQVMARLCPVGHAVRALPRRHQPQSGGVRERRRHGARDRRPDPLHRAVRSRKNHMSDFIETNFPRQVELLKALVRVPSDNPPGDCAPHARGGAGAAGEARLQGRGATGAGRARQASTAWRRSPIWSCASASGRGR